MMSQQVMNRKYRMLNYFHVKVAKAEINFLKLHGKLKLQFHTKRKIIAKGILHKKQISEIEKSNKEYLEVSKQFLKSNFDGYRDVRWHRCFAALNGIKKVNYIPDDIFFTVFHKVLNNEELAMAYKDKNILEKTFPEVNTPTTVLRIIKGRYYAQDYSLIDENIELLFSNNERYVFKPAIDSGSGQGVIVGRKSEIIDSINKAMGGEEKQKNYIVQKYLIQHEAIKKLHPESLNTMRIMTLRLGGKIHHISSVLRMGRNGNTVDNFGSGGISTGIDRNGKLKKYAFDLSYNRYATHSNSNIKFEGYQIPKHDEAVALCKKMHTKLLHFDLVSWDIAISLESEIFIVEYNIHGQSIDLHQLSNGPIFGDLTNEVIDSLSR